jgi:alditol oxidase
MITDGNPMSSSMTNWAGNVTFRAHRVHRPASVAALQLLVARSSRARALGTGHSFSPVADTTGDLIVTAGLPRLIELDSARGTVTVGAGLRYGEVAGPLHAAGRGLASLASLPHISVAGACATGTHGSGDDTPVLAAAVRGLEMVGADGDLVRLDRGAADFAAAVVGLGAFGIVTALTLDTVPAFEVRQYVYDDIPLEQALENFDRIFRAACSVSLFTTFRRPVIDQAWLKHRVDEPGVRTTGGCGESSLAGTVAVAGPSAPHAGTAEPEWLGGRLADGPRHPISGQPAGFCTQQLGVPGPWHERLPHFRLDFTPSTGDELQSEYLLPRASGRDALTALHGIGRLLAPVLRVAEIRTIAADHAWLSPCYGRDSVGFHFTWISDGQAVAPALAAVEERLAPLGARPHWGKLFGMTPETVRGRYPRADDFRRLMRDYDPDGKFRNRFLDRYLPL